MMRGLLDDGVKLLVGVRLFLLLLLLFGVVGCVDGIDDCTEVEERGRGDGVDTVNFELCVFGGNVKEDGSRAGRGGGGGGGG